ncbi:MAG TPA: CPBP family intramembrane glutamic endopeptidase [Candidatus Binataceae bacterium]|nr:CPBP family intramembrane glutamic endopeptidase [Candidatus Binataceae bacterium]
MQVAETATTEISAPSAIRIWLGLTLALSAYAALLALGLWNDTRLTGSQLTNPVRLVSFWSPLMGLGVVGIVKFIEDAPLSSMGLRRPRFIDVDWGLVFFVFAMVTMARIGPVVDAHVRGIGFRMNEFSLLKGWTMIIFAATMEELFFRGYLLERFERVTGSTWIAALASLTLFAFGHLPGWGPAGVVRNLVWGAFVTGLYVWRRNLPICMMMHFLQNTSSLPSLWYTPLKRVFARGVF